MTRNTFDVIRGIVGQFSRLGQVAASRILHTLRRELGSLGRGRLKVAVPAGIHRLRVRRLQQLGREHLRPLRLLQIRRARHRHWLLRVMAIDARRQSPAIQRMHQVSIVLAVIESGFGFELAPLRILTVFRKYDRLVRLRGAGIRNCLALDGNRVRRSLAVKWFRRESSATHNRSRDCRENCQRGC